MVSCIPIKTWMWTNSVYQLPNILSKGEVWNFQRDKLCSLLMVNAEKWAVKMKVEAMPTCYCPTFMCCQPCRPTFQWFQSCVSWTPLCIFSCYVSHAVVSGMYPLVAISLAWSKVLVTVGWVWWRHQRALLFSLASGPPTLNPPLTPKLGISVEMVQFLLYLLMKQKILAVYHDFHLSASCYKIVESQTSFTLC